MSLVLDPIGVLLALALLGISVGIIWWLSHPPDEIQVAVKRAQADVSKIRRILVPVRGSDYNERALELACRLGEAQRAEIVACHVIEVPMALPLTTDLTAEEQHGNEVLDRAVRLIESHGLKAHRSMARDRDVARGVLRAVEAHDVHVVVLGVNPRNLAAGESVGDSTEQLLRRSHVEVIVDMHPEIGES